MDIDNGIHYDLTNESNSDALMLFGRALNSPVRLGIMRMLNVKPMTLTEIAAAFDMPVSSASVHMQILLDAKLTRIDYSTKRKGHIKYFSYPMYKNIDILLRDPIGSGNSAKPIVYKINIGDYIDAKFGYCCGLANEKEMIMELTPDLAFIPERHSAQILFTNDGYVTYALPNDFAKNGDVSRVEIMLEICSEAAGYNEHFESDVSFFLNDKRVCVYTAPGDFGARYGKYTPDWWFGESTKYGMPVTFSVTADGVYLNGKHISKTPTPNDLELGKGNRILFRIEVEKDAKHRGGFNLFGDKFGDYDIPIVFTAYVDKNKQIAK